MTDPHEPAIRAPAEAAASAVRGAHTKPPPRPRGYEDSVLWSLNNSLPDRETVRIDCPIGLLRSTPYS